MPRYRKEWKRRMNMGERTFEEPKEEKKKQRTIEDWEEKHED